MGGPHSSCQCNPHALNQCFSLSVLLCTLRSPAAGGAATAARRPAARCSRAQRNPHYSRSRHVIQFPLRPSTRAPGAPMAARMRVAHRCIELEWPLHQRGEHVDLDAAEELRLKTQLMTSKEVRTAYPLSIEWAPSAARPAVHHLTRLSVRALPPRAAPAGAAAGPVRDWRVQGRPNTLDAAGWDDSDAPQLCAPRHCRPVGGGGEL